MGVESYDGLDGFDLEIGEIDMIFDMLSDDDNDVVVWMGWFY